MIIIKPHHFLDIIKLYGKGIEHFVPDEAYHHDFYAVANEIVGNPAAKLQLTLGKDRICEPCKYLDANGICADRITHIPELSSKDAWNKRLDLRIMNYCNASEGSQYTALEFCTLLYSIKDHIFEIWQEESDAAKQNRYDAFCSGAIKYLEVNVQ